MYGVVHDSFFFDGLTAFSLRPIYIYICRESVHHRFWIDSVKCSPVHDVY